MKKNKTKNKILAVAVISALLCAMFCITSFAWDNSWTVEPFVPYDDIPDGYTLITVSDCPSELSNSSFDASIYCRTSSYIHLNRLKTGYTGLAGEFDDTTRLIVNLTNDTVYNGGCFYVEDSKVTDVLSYLESAGITASAPDPVQDIFDNVAIGVSGSLSAVSSFGQFLATNTLTVIMCIALPLCSFGVGLLIRLKDRS